MRDFKASFKDIQNRVQKALMASQRPSQPVRIIGVSKKQPISKVLTAWECGLNDFGENYVQEWKSKRDQFNAKYKHLANGIHWHFIGHLQTNKVREVVGQLDYIHTIDSIKLARMVSNFAQKISISQKVLIEVNLASETTKYGFDPKSLLEGLPTIALLPNVSLEGLMAIPPPLTPNEKMRPYFSELKSLLDECNRLGVLKSPMKELSMGMSQDFEIAIQEGATMIRIGTALFGPRENEKN